MRSVWLGLLLISLAGCQKKSPAEQADSGRVTVVPAAPDASRAEAEAADALPPPREAGAGAPFVGTAGIVQKKHALSAVAVQRDVRAGRHEGYDRVVFEFEGGALPSYHVEYIDKPIYRCGSGQVVQIAGDGWLRVRFDMAAAHDDRGKATIAEADRQRKYDLGVLSELTLTCDFEAQVVWVLGVASPNRYRVLELDKPSRLVVDIRHR